MSLLDIFRKQPNDKIKRHLYDKKLIPKLKKEHKILVSYIVKVQKAIKKGDEKKIKYFLQILDSQLVKHFMKEDLKLYWYLKNYYKDDAQMLAYIKSFEENIKEIQKVVINFFDTYTHKNATIDENFYKTFSQIIEALSNRIHSEEKELYTWYIPCE